MRAIDFEAMVAGNREKLLAMSTRRRSCFVWNPTTMGYDYAEDIVTADCPLNPLWKKA